VVWEVKKGVTVLVGGCGDVVEAEPTVSRFSETGVDAVMIGRGAIANPWIFRQRRELMQGEAVYQPRLEEKQRVLHRYYELLRDEMSEKGLSGKLKQMCGYFTHGLAGGARLRERVFHSQTIEGIFHEIEEDFASMINRRRAPDSGRDPASFVDPGPRDPKCAQFAVLSSEY